MADKSYAVSSKSIDIPEESKEAYEDLAVLLLHMKAIGARLQTLTVKPDGTFEVKLDREVSADQLGHLKLGNTGRLDD